MRAASFDHLVGVLQERLGDTAATILHRNLIITLAARHRLPAVYPYRFFASK
jgi:hypothetical protein